MNKLKHYIAPDGMVYQAIDDETFWSRELWLGINDSIDNYRLIEEPTPPEEEEVVENEEVIK